MNLSQKLRIIIKGHNKVKIILKRISSELIPALLNSPNLLV